MIDFDFYKDKKVFVTGHTGFKGVWLCKLLSNAGAVVTGYSLEPPTEPNLFEKINFGENFTSITGDIRDFEKLKKAFDSFSPEIVFHLAAQPLVLDSFKKPRYTYETNVMGTVNVLECARLNPCAKSILNVTTDKVYLNRDLNNAFKEDEPLDGFDPYSNSKSCSELVTHSFKNSFFDGSAIAVSTARAGNVLGGGDFAKNRIIPDCIRAMEKKERIIVRNPHSVRPFQHVLEPLVMYMIIAMKQYENIKYAGYYNIGPDLCDCITTGELAELFCKHFKEGAEWTAVPVPDAPHEAEFLRLDNSKIKETFGWKPTWHIDKCIEMTCRFAKVWMAGGNVCEEMDSEIKEFLMEYNGTLE